MKHRLIFLVLLTIAGIAISSCNQKNKYRPDSFVVTAFNNKFPEVKQIQWQQKQGYQVAEFEENGMKSEVWFDTTGRWLMTISSLKYNALSQAIRKQFETSQYANWKKEEIDKIERADMPSLYVIEIGEENRNTYLYYKEDGTQIKVSDNVTGDIKYIPLNPVIKEQIIEKYPHATIIEADVENGMLKIDIIDNGRPKEIRYNGMNWESTSWKVSKTEVPTVVMNTYRHSAYGKHRLNALHFYETPTISYYLFNLEQNSSQALLRIDTDGNK